jgi:DNA modification methylase
MTQTQSEFAEAGPTRPWPAERIERWPIERLIPYANNARLHSEADLDKIAAAIRKWGWTNPVLTDEEGEVISGHGRLGAAPRAGVTEIPVIVARGWSEEEKRAYRLADNQLAARAEWDPDLLRKELQELGFADFDLGLTGFESDALEAILKGLGSSGLTDPDSVPEVPEQPVTQPGDIWLLGDHRVGCGDSTNAADVAQVLTGSEPHLMITDPPYGVGYDPSWRARRNLSKGKLAQGTVLNDDRADWREAYGLFSGDVAYVWHSAMHGDLVLAGLTGCGLQPRAQIIWSKQHFTLSRGDYHWQHETCWYAVRQGRKSHWHGDRTQTTVWEIANNNPFGNPGREESWGHGTQKPVECMRRPIVNNSRPGAAVYDPFLGSGTTAIAAEITGRICYGLELNPAFVDVIVQRWQRFTARHALHQASGQSFDERAETQHHD